MSARREVTQFSSDMFMADEHRPVIWLAEIAALLRGPLIVQRSGSESTLTDETRFSQGGTEIVHPRAILMSSPPSSLHRHICDILSQTSSKKWKY